METIESSEQPAFEFGHWFEESIVGGVFTSHPIPFRA